MEKKALRQSAIVLARVLGFIELADLISGVRFSVSEIVKRLAEHYQFQQYPKTLEEIDPSKGIEFLEGFSGGFPISKFVIWDTLLILETKVDTDVSTLILEEILGWSANEFGINYAPGAIRRFGYISDVTFFSDAPIFQLHEAVNRISSRTSEELSRIWKEPVRYEPLGIRAGHDPSSRKYPIAPFSIEYRKESRFSEKKYFSEAPLPTKIHWEMLEQFEKDMSPSPL